MTAALEGDEWSAARPGHTLPPGKIVYPFYRRLDGTQVTFSSNEVCKYSQGTIRIIHLVDSTLHFPLSYFQKVVEGRFFTLYAVLFAIVYKHSQMVFTLVSYYLCL